jgi:hypothetical protein
MATLLRGFQIAQETLEGGHLKAKTIDGTKLADGFLASIHIGDSVIVTRTIENGQVTEEKLSVAVQNKLNSTASRVIAQVAPTVTDVEPAGTIWINESATGEEPEAYMTSGSGHWFDISLTAENLGDLATMNKTALKTEFESSLVLAIDRITGLQTELDSKVSLTGDQTVSGVKTFSNIPIFSSGVTINGTTVTGIRTSIRAAASAEDSKLATEKAIADALKVVTDNVEQSEILNYDADGIENKFAFANANGTTVVDASSAEEKVLVYRNGQLLKREVDYALDIPFQNVVFATAPKVTEIITTMRFYKLGN